MAAPRENLLSLGHLTGTDREAFNTFTNRKEHSLKKSLNRSMTLQADFSTHQSSQHLRMKHLQQHWQELKERERAAQQHNKQLLQQFEEAQDALREMMARTAAMKTIRIEYERYLEESSPRWEQQFKEKTEAAQRKRIDEYLKTCLENTEEQVTKSSVDQPLLSQAQTKKPQKFSAPQEYHRQNSHSNYNQYEALPSTWLTRSQPHTFRFPVRVPYQPQVSSQAPPSFLPHPHPFHLQHLAATPGHHHPQPRQNPPGWPSSQPDHSWFWASGGAGIPSGYEALLGQLYMAQPPHDRGVAPVVAEEAETSRAPRPKTDRGGGSRSSDSSQELDIKPVRLSSGHAGSSESGRDSSQVSREKKKKKREKRGREQRTSSERESCSSQESSRTSSAIVVALAAAAQTLGSEASSEKGSSSSKKTRRRIEDVVAESPRMEKVAKEKNRSRGDVHESPSKESHCTGEESEESRSENDGNQSPVEKSESCRDESECQRDEGSGSVSIQLENGDPDKSAEQESSSSKQSGAGQKVVEGTGHKTELEDGEEDDEESGEDEEPNSQRDELQEDRGVEDDDVSAGKNAIVEEEETGAEDEMEEEEESSSDEDQRDDEEQSDKLRNKDDEVRKQASSQDEEVDEDESEGSEDKREDDDDDDDNGGSDEDGSGEEDNEQSSDKAEVVEEKDSDDSIISPQENRPRKINIIPEESAEDNDEMDGNKTGSSNDDLNEISDEDDVEDLLAPQTQTKKTEEKVPKTEEEPKAVCDKVEIFQLTSSKSDLQSDSDEFDHFYD